MRVIPWQEHRQLALSLDSSLRLSDHHPRAMVIFCSEQDLDRTGWVTN